MTDSWNSQQLFQTHGHIGEITHTYGKRGMPPIIRKERNGKNRFTEETEKQRKTGKKMKATEREERKKMDDRRRGRENYKRKRKQQRKNGEQKRKKK